MIKELLLLLLLLTGPTGEVTHEARSRRAGGCRQFGVGARAITSRYIVYWNSYAV